MYDMSGDLLSVLPENVLVSHVAPVATSRELCHLCMASRDVCQLEPVLAREVAKVQHGIFEVLEDGKAVDRPFTLNELYHTLDSVRDRALFEFTRPFMAAILKPERREGVRHESEFMLVDVGGGRTGYRTVAACPPVQGDYWRLLVPLRRGLYRLDVTGWRNPHHGILDITLDNKAVSPPEGLDWYAEFATSPHTFPPIFFEVETTATHVLGGATNRCHSSALGAKYWMCLESIRIIPADEAEPEISAATVVSSSLPCRGPTSHRRPAPVLAAQAAAERVVSVAVSAALSTGQGLKLGKHAASWAALRLTGKLLGSLRTVHRSLLRCPCRRALQ